MAADHDRAEHVDEDKPLIIIVQGSPRSDGNSALLAIEAFNACEAAEFEAVIVSSAALMNEAARCNGCLHCVATGQCVHDDEVGLFIDMLDEASGLIWITPIYFASVPACLKELIDRMQVFWARRQRDEAVVFDQRRPAIALVVGSGEDPFGTDAVTIPLKSVSQMAEFALAEPTILLGLEDTDALLQEENVDRLKEARASILAFVADVKAWDDAE
ncbi:MAG: flavodoxin family protein [Actinomycetia bacterium]|nr:flavodoxin family protein [Actinomycetes bacterium]